MMICSCRGEQCSFVGAVLVAVQETLNSGRPKVAPTLKIFEAFYTFGNPRIGRCFLNGNKLVKPNFINKQEVLL